MSDEKRENLWLKMLRDYWSDPKNVIGPPGALVRRVFKCLWFVLSLYVLFFIAGPSQVASWRLWMADDGLAWNIAWGFTIAGALGFAIVRYAAEGTNPIKVPTPLPRIAFNEWGGEGKWHERMRRGWSVRMVHLHLPNLTVALGSALVAGLFVISLLGMWNYYLHDNLSSGGASFAATDTARSSVRDAEAALVRHNEEAAQAAATRQAQAAGCNTGYSPTGCSRMETAHAASVAAERAERARLEAALAAARSATVTVATTSADPRPVDGVVSGALKADRAVVASSLDLARSGIVEALLVLGAALSLAGATSNIGVSREPLSTKPEPEDEDETVIATPGAPQEPEPPPPPPRPRFLLPLATDADIARAMCVGPTPRPEAGPSTEGWEPPEADEGDDAGEADNARPESNAAADDDEFDDPLARALADEEKEPA